MGRRASPGRRPSYRVRSPDSPDVPAILAGDERPLLARLPPARGNRQLGSSDIGGEDAARAAEDLDVIPRGARDRRPRDRRGDPPFALGGAASSDAGGSGVVGLPEAVAGRRRHGRWLSPDFLAEAGVQSDLHTDVQQPQQGHPADHDRCHSHQHAPRAHGGAAGRRTDPPYRGRRRSVWLDGRRLSGERCESRGFECRRVQPRGLGRWAWRWVHRDGRRLSGERCESRGFECRRLQPVARAGARRPVRRDGR